MHQATVSLLAGWTNFYEIVGSSAGALTGLQFVVMTLIAQVEIESGMREIRAFGSPTVVHFCTALLISAVMSAPWHALVYVGICLTAWGAAGVLYATGTIWHARKARYTPDVEDWIWYAALPLAGYVSLLTAAILLWWEATVSLVIIPATTLLFLFVGIHNAWDTVTYIATQRRQPARKPDDPGRSENDFRG